MPPAASNVVRYSVLLVTIDALRPDYMSMNGYDQPTTPFIDALLADGLYFEQAVATVPRTTPALASMLTGAYPHSTGVRTLTDTLSDSVILLPDELRQAGYQTIAVVTNNVLSPPRRLNRGFDQYDYARDIRPASETTAAALALLDKVDPSRPFFLWVHYIDPHVPYHPPPELARKFDAGYDGPYALNFGVGPQAGKPVRRVIPFPPELGMGGAVFHNRLAPRVNQHIRRLYAADIRSVDDAVRPVVDAARSKADGMCLVVVSADHGESLGEHDHYFAHGDYAYNSAARIPLGFVLPSTHPAYRRGRVSDWVSGVDVTPTLLELLGLRASPNIAAQFEGRSLAPYFRNEATEPVPVYLESDESFASQFIRRRKENTVAGRFRAVIVDNWKLIWTPLQTGNQEWELYNLLDDPRETSDVYRPDHPRFEKARDHLMAWFRRGELKDRGRRSSPSDLDREQLRGLGYLGD